MYVISPTPPESLLGRTHNESQQEAMLGSHFTMYLRNINKKQVKGKRENHMGTNPPSKYNAKKQDNC